MALRYPVIGGYGTHLERSQLVRNHAHLFVDVVLPHALGEGREFALDVFGVLSPQ